MAKDKIQLPSGMGGLTRYFDDYKSKIQIQPGQVIVLIIVITILILLLHQFGSFIIGG